jgi:exodeoxyribonuclease V alpha subunit
MTGERLTARIEGIRSQNPDSGWTVAALDGPAGPVTAVGMMFGAHEGDEVRLTGRWENHRQFGRQFRVESCVIAVPATARGIQTYLAGGRFPGIGPEMAKRIVTRFGERTLSIIEETPERLAEVDGIGRVRAERLREGIRGFREVQDVIVFLHDHGVSPAFASRIHRRYGAGTIAAVRENPYRLALEVWGIGFKTADAIARSLGFEKTSPARAEAGLLHVLHELVEDGHVHAPEHELLRDAEKTLEVDREILAPALARLVGGGLVVREELGDRGTCISRRDLWQAETGVAQGIARILAAPPKPIELDVERALAWFEREHSISLAPQQRDAVRAAAEAKVVVITGGPGVGKTTVVNAIIRILERKGRRILLGAPTGRAAKRMTEATGRPAATLHRLLEYTPRAGGFSRTRDLPLDADLVIVDEASMLDVFLAHALVEAIPPAAQLVLVGDVDQLPSVGPGRVLADVIASRRARVVRLTEIFRQAAASNIVVNAHRVNRGEAPDLAAGEGSDFYFIDREEPGDVLATILEIVADRIPRRFGLDPIDGVQVLAPMHRGDVGAANLNTALQARLNPPLGVPRSELNRGNRTFRVGDKVIQLKNDYDKDVFNGDIGRVTAILDGGLVVDIDGRPIQYQSEELDQLGHAFALSVHKSQGSEYPAVVVPLVTQHFMLLQRNLLYTAITRGKRLVVLVGSRKALGIAVRNDDTRLRWTWLAERLRSQ